MNSKHTEVPVVGRHALRGGTPKRRPELLSFDQAHEYLNVTPAWLRRAVAERRLPLHKFNRLLRFDRAALDEFIADSLVEAEE